MTHTPAPHDTAPHDTPTDDAQEQRPDIAGATAAPSPSRPPQHGERRAVVGIGIALASLLFIAASGMLYLRWATVREPMCFFIVEASTALRGAEVTVDGVKLLKPHAITIGRGERFAIPFYLDYGTYTVRVTMNGETVVDTEVVLDQKMPYQRLDLTQLQLPASSSATSSPPSPPSPSWGLGGGFPTTTSSPLLPRETDGLPPLPSGDDGVLR
jgi:hypothetical protein